MAINFCWLSSRSGSKIRRDIPTGNNSRPNTNGQNDGWKEDNFSIAFLAFKNLYPFFRVDMWKIDILKFCFFFGMVLMACHPKKWVAVFSFLRRCFLIFAFKEQMGVTVIRTGWLLYVVLPRNLT